MTPSTPAPQIFPETVRPSDDPRSGSRSGRGGAALIIGLAAVLCLGAWLMTRGGLAGAEGSGVQPDDVQGLSDSTGADLELGLDALHEGALEGTGERSSAGPAGSGRVRLPGPGNLLGTVRHRADGAGVPGVTVRLLPVPPVAADIAPDFSSFIGIGDDYARRATAIADADSGPSGLFSFEGVREGRWYLDVRSPYHVLDGAVSAKVLGSGAGGPVDVWVRSGGRVHGQVVGPDGVPVAGAVVAMGTGAMRFLEAAAAGDVALLRETANQNGEFEFTGVPPGEGYELAALGSGMSIVHVLEIVVRAEEDTFVFVEGMPGTRVVGRILSGPLAEGEEPLPLAGAKVGALPRGLRQLKLARELLSQSHAVTGLDGSYVLEGIRSGEVDILAMADGHVPGRGPLVQVTGVGAAVAAYFVLARGPMVRGRVVDEEGRSVAGARLLWNVIDIQQAEGRPTMAALFVGGMADFEFPRTDAEGRFVAGPFARKPPYSLRILADGFEAQTLAWEPSELGRTVDGIAEPERLDEVEVVLHRGGAVTGTVVDGSTGEPITSFSLRITGKIEMNPEAPSTFNPFAEGLEVEDPAGRFSIPAVAAGLQTLNVAADGFLSRELEVDVMEQAMTEPITVALDPGARIVGIVEDANGEPIAGAQVTTERLMKESFERMESKRVAIEEGLEVRGRTMQRMPPVGFLRYAVALGLLGSAQVATGEDGGFEICGLEPGTHEVLAFHRDYRAGSNVANAAVGGEPDVVRVVLTEGGGLRGKVRDRFGRPVAGGTVVAASPGLARGSSGNGALHQARTNADGDYEIRHMEGGPYILITTRGDEALAITSLLSSLQLGFVSVPADRMLEHDLVDRAAGACRVSGRVFREGEPVSDGVLVAVGLEAEGLLGVDFKFAPIEDDGTYSFESLAPGEYQVRLEERPRSLQRAKARGTVFFEVPDAPELLQDVVLPVGRIKGRAVAKSDREPIAGARVELRPLGGNSPDGALAQILASRGEMRTSTTDGGGKFGFTDLGPGRYSVTVSRATRASEDGKGRITFAPFEIGTDELQEDESMDLGDLALNPGATVSGVVTDENGQPTGLAVVTASVRGKASGALRSVEARTGEDGTFRLEGLGPGGWTAVAEAEGYASGQGFDFSIDLDGAPPERLSLVLTRGIEVTAAVFTNSGEPVAGATCVLKRKGDDSMSSVGGSSGLFRRLFSGDVATDESGELLIGRFAPGSYQLRVSSGFRTRTFDVEVTGSDTQTLSVTLP